MLHQRHLTVNKCQAEQNFIQNEKSSLNTTHANIILLITAQIGCHQLNAKFSACP